MAMTFSTNRVCAARGFTLIETVVALLIVSLGMTAVFMQLGQFATSAILMQDKTLASWIGSNVVTELSLETAWPAFGDSDDEIEYAGRLWNVNIVISETEVENLRRADVSVSLADRPERIIHRVSGLIEPPVPQGFPPVNWLSVGRGGPRG
jgi:general secretion pathway protein I